MQANRWTLINALTVAAERYELDAREHAASPLNSEAQQRLAFTMSQLAHTVRKLMDEIEISDIVRLED